MDESHGQQPTSGGRTAATIGGLAALAVWSMTVAIARSMSESLGTLTGPALAMGAGGIIALAVSWVRGCSPAAMLRLPRKYLFGCGGLFAAYMFFMYAAIGWAPNRSTAVVVGLVNYLWPTLTVVFSIPLLRRRARWPAAVGCVAAVAGTAVAVLGGEQFQWRDVGAGGTTGLVVLLLAGGAAVTWALYSNLVKLWGRPDAGAVPLFLLASAVLLGLLRLGRHEETVWTLRAFREFCVIAVATSALAYVLWERGMRRGNHLLLSVASYLTPIAATGIAAAYLKVRPGWGLVVGCILVTGGALICRFSIQEGNHGAC